MSKMADTVICPIYIKSEENDLSVLHFFIIIFFIFYYLFIYFILFLF